MDKVLRFDNKNAVLIGGTGGIGSHVAQILYNQGAKIIMCDLPDDAENIKKRFLDMGVEIEYEQLDITDPDRIRSTAAKVKEKYGGADVLINISGIGACCDALDFPDETWRKVMSINLDGTFYCVREFAKQMKERGGGSIVCISSTAAFIALRPEHHVAYGVSKAGVLHMCKLLAAEWSQYNIRINAIVPGHTDTRALDKMEAFKPIWKSNVPMGRLMEPIEVARGIVFLASPAASGVTGTHLVVDGGALVW